jgi:hypothetical protein
MRFIAVSKNYRVLYFAAYHAIWTNCSGAIYARTHFYHGSLAQGKRTAYIATFHHLGILTDIDWAVGGIQHAMLQLGAGLDKYFVGIYGNHRFRDDPGISIARHYLEIFLQRPSIPLENMPRVL